MSSLQKFHRRTLNASGPVTWPPTAIGGGDETNGFWLGGGYFNALIAAPKSTDVSRVWGSYGTARDTTNTTNGLANTTTLFGFGSSVATGHPAAYHAKSLTTGGYNTWYLPAKDELMTMYSNKSAEPFATANSFVSVLYWSSTELNGTNAFFRNMGTGGQSDTFKDTPGNIRATRRVSLATTVGQGSDTIGYWLGSTGLLGSSKLVAAPKSTEVQRAWGSSGTTRGTTNTVNGLLNTNTLYAFGAATVGGHPAAHYTKTLTTGGYNTWYLPAQNELNTLYSNKSAVPFATANSFVATSSYSYWSSTELNGGYARRQVFATGAAGSYGKSGNFYVRAVRAVEGTLAIGAGNDTQGYWLGTAGDGTSKMIVAPKSTEVQRVWGSSGTVRNANRTADGLTNTNILFGFSSAAHPAAYYTKALTTGGYNTWYLPAKDELMTVYSNNSAVPFATANKLGIGNYFWTSTEITGTYVWSQYMGTGGQFNTYPKTIDFIVRAVRRV